VFNTHLNGRALLMPKRKKGDCQVEHDLTQPTVQWFLFSLFIFLFFLIVFYARRFAPGHSRRRPSEKEKKRIFLLLFFSIVKPTGVRQ
jgi:hypothetical protein